MGREALIRADVAGISAEVKVLLESTELILRAPIGRRFPTSAITEVVVDGEMLRLRCGAEPLVLYLGERAARSWATAITTPPPTLRDKLGLAGEAQALLIGDTDDAELLAAMQNSLTADRTAATLLIACIHGPEDLRDALAALSAGPAVPIWTVYPKGKGVTFGDGEIREILRGEGLRDTKSCAVSAALTATRYQPPRS